MYIVGMMAFPFSASESDDQAPGTSVVAAQPGEPARSPALRALRSLANGPPPTTLGEVEARLVRLLGAYEVLGDLVDAKLGAAIEQEEFTAHCATESLVAAAKQLGLAEGLGFTASPKTLPEGMSEWVSVEDVAVALKCGLSKANEYLRAAGGRIRGSGKQLRVPVDVWEVWSRKNLQGQDAPKRGSRGSAQKSNKARQLGPAERGVSRKPLIPVMRGSGKD